MTPEQRARYNAKLAKDPERQARLRASAADRASTRERVARRDPVGWVVYNLRVAKRRAQKQGIPFDITAADVVVPEVCPVLGVALTLEAYGQRADNGPSLDRKDPAKGYVKGNVFVISWLANRLKSNCTDPAVFRRIAEYLEGCHDHRN